MTTPKSMTERELLGLILERRQPGEQYEELIHALLEGRYDSRAGAAPGFSERSADRIAAFVGSWPFILVFLGFLGIWMAVNALGREAFDPYPFILLNLVLSCVAAIQAPLIMMSQNRQDQKDRERAESAYLTGLKAEVILKDLHYKIDAILEATRGRLAGADGQGSGADEPEGGANGAKSRVSDPPHPAGDSSRPQ